MGIRGLSTYMENHSHMYLQYYELHDTYLVIDGNNIAVQIYCNYSNCNCAFGGDYDTYAESVSLFFDDLLKCNITPLVLMDGGVESKKMKTVMTRMKEKTRTASEFSPCTQRYQKFFPLLLKTVFTDIMRSKNIKYAQCTYEADHQIVALARNLNCPILSLDSDFYIYGTLYVPFNTLKRNIFESSIGQGYVKHCQIFKLDRFLHTFQGLKESMLPLAAVLLGNDYVQHNTLKIYFNHLKLEGASRKKFNQQQCRIKATFQWLCKYTLDNAIIAILSKVVKSERQRILTLIEDNINVYMNTVTEPLVLLTLKIEVVIRHVSKPYKFKGDINTLNYIKEVCDEENNTSNKDGETVVTNELYESVTLSQDIINELPTHFLNKYHMSVYPSYVINLIIDGLYICFSQVENFVCAPSFMVCLEIFNVICALLNLKKYHQRNFIKCIIRGQKANIESKRIKLTNLIPRYEHISLSNIESVPFDLRKDILDTCLGVQNVDMNEFPSAWTLYIACIKYWIEHQDPSISHKCYVYSIFVSLLFKIIDNKIGRYRHMNRFNKKYGMKIIALEKERKANVQYEEATTVINAYNRINSEDCILVAPFFISHFKMNETLYSHTKQFHRTTVHVFAEFQYCLKISMDLNNFLEEPYEKIEIADLFNGTLLYNLSVNFRARLDIENYIHNILQKSPTLLSFFTAFLRKIKTLFPLLLQNQSNPK